MSEPLESDPSLLVVVLDVNASAWSRSPLTVDNALQQMIIFINAYLALKPENKLVVLATNKRECKCLYPADRANATIERDIRVYEQFRVVDATVLSGVQSMLSGAEETVSDPNRGIEEGQTLMSRALSKALCHIHRVVESTTSKVWSRILVLSAADDSPREYISLMNTIFAAQRMSVLIDICKVFGSDSVFLQQAAEITGGNYLKVDTAGGESMLQTLMFTCLADHYTREVLVAPTNETIDFRATCFCHKRVVDIGYVCSVCLSIFCETAPVCSTCQTKFSFRIARAESAQANGFLKQSPKPAAATAAMSTLTLSSPKV
ncbi:RNA polymerase II transcription factor B subunit 4 [Coemansia aciculifera]|uniref:General transcription and DNA repair factor IIH subunit TFB4 n=1 Tax=Coemansia aciculifera TaxID=417176 RepID=A0A9W8M3L7_9FUNG|nr:RNA polymerase II transcription factor B subunit 4 [Coemansia aciculifera]KAJ2870361.1 RNA polymerase II transcription factor B subunit 4 [Coemansia aciculifera]